MSLESDKTPGDESTESPTPTEGKRPGPVRRLYDWVLHWADTRFGTPALALVSFTESSFFPIPPDPLLMALAISKPKRAIFYGIICTVASVLGGLMGYVIGAVAFEALGQPIIDFYGLQHAYDELKIKFEDFAFLSILAAALTPIPYKVFTIAAGSFGLPLTPFLTASFLGRGLRFLTEAVLIRLFGEPIRGFIDRYFNLLAILFVVLMVVGFWIVKKVL